MITKVNNDDYRIIKSVLEKDIVKSMYILGDIERYGLNGANVELFLRGGAF